MDWRWLFQLGFYTVSIIIGAAVIVGMLAPNFDLRGALVLIAVVALLLGWVL